MKLCLSILVVLLIPAATGCQSKSEEVDQQNQEANQQRGEAAGLVGKPKWSLHRMIVGGEEWDLSLDSKLRKLVPDSQVTISFTPTQVQGNTGCNHLSGTYIAKADGTFQWQSGGVTEMPCPGRLAEQQAELLRLLSLASHWQIEDKVLTLSDSKGSNRLEFVPYNRPSLPLQTTRWRLTHFTQSDDQIDSAEPVLPDHPIELQLMAGQASGSMGASQFQYDVKVLDGGRLVFQAPSATEKRRMAEHSQHEDRFLGLLPQMTRYTIREKTLSLTNEPGTLGLQFEGLEVSPDERPRGRDSGSPY
jgi:heat shock protein HslJ